MPNPGLWALLRADWMQLLRVAEQPDRPLRLRNLFSPRFLPVTLIRIGGALHRRRLGPLAKLASLFNFVWFGIEVPNSLAIGPGLVLPHTQGTVLGAARIGSNVTIFHQVTLGAVTADFGYDLAKRPVIEDGVTIGVGAKVLGGLVLGHGCTIGANAVVLGSIPSGATAVGIPARIARAGEASQA